MRPTVKPSSGPHPYNCNCLGSRGHCCEGCQNPHNTGGNWGRSAVCDLELLFALHVCMALHGQCIVPELPPASCHCLALDPGPGLVVPSSCNTSQGLSRVCFDPADENCLDISNSVPVSKSAKYPGAHRTRQGASYPSSSPLAP